MDRVFFMLGLLVGSLAMGEVISPDKCYEQYLATKAGQVTEKITYQFNFPTQKLVERILAQAAAPGSTLRQLTVAPSEAGPLNSFAVIAFNQGLNDQVTPDLDSLHQFETISAELAK